MAFSIRVKLFVISENCLLLDSNCNIPSVLVDKKTIFDTASDFAENLLNIKIIKYYSGWLCLTSHGYRDEPLRIENGERVIEFIYSIIVPEKINLKEKGYTWEDIKSQKIPAMEKKVLLF